MTLFYVSMALVVFGVLLARNRAYRAGAFITLIGLCVLGVSFYQLKTRGGAPRVDVGAVSRLIAQDVSPMKWIAWSPTGERIATCSEHGDVHVWTISDQKVKHNLYVAGTLGLSDQPSGLVWLNGGNQLAKMSAYGLEMWSIPNSDSGHSTMVYASKDVKGKWLASDAKSDRLAWTLQGAPVIVIFDVSTKSTIPLDVGAHGETASIDWQPSGALIVTGQIDGTWVLWNDEVHSKVREQQGHQQSITASKWRPDGRAFATGSVDSSVRIWADSGDLMKTIDEGGRPQAVTDISWSSDGKFLAASRSDGTVTVWNPNTGKQIAQGSGFGEQRAYSVAWRPGSTTLAVGAEGVVWSWTIPQAN